MALRQIDNNEGKENEWRSAAAGLSHLGVIQKGNRLSRGRSETTILL